MNYTKPEVAEMGQAVRVIEGSRIKGAPFKLDADPSKGNTAVAPAYDLDE